MLYSHNVVKLDEGDFETDLVRFTGNFDLTPELSFSANIQYDNVSRELGMNNRVRWIITPGSDIYLVYNHNWFDLMERFVEFRRSLALKVNYTARF